MSPTLPAPALTYRPNYSLMLTWCRRSSRRGYCNMVIFLLIVSYFFIDCFHRLLWLKSLFKRITRYIDRVPALLILQVCTFPEKNCHFDSWRGSHDLYTLNSVKKVTIRLSLSKTYNISNLEIFSSSMIDLI